jgi:hypothetical protein
MTTRGSTRTPSNQVAKKRTTLSSDTPEGKAVRELLANGFIAGVSAAVIELTNKVSRLEGELEALRAKR